LALRTDALVLAAGAGARFGGGKLLAPYAGGPLLEGALGAALAGPARRVLVVWGADPRVALVAVAFARRIGAEARLELVHAPRHGEGLSASLAAGVKALPEDGEAVFVHLGDMPRTPPALAPRLAAALALGAAAAAPTFAGRRGHPVLFARTLWPELLRLAGDRGAGALLADLGDRLALVPAEDDGVLFDVDRPLDLEGP
jgi:molybdenum cofactor cytidylyltransferase